MKVQAKIQAPKRTLPMLTGTLAVASGAFASTAAACNAYGPASATPGRATPPVLGVTYSRLHPVRKVLRGEKIPEGRMLVNTAGVASRLGVLVRVDESFHAVNAKGFRVGGRTLDS